MWRMKKFKEEYAMKELDEIMVALSEHCAKHKIKGMLEAHFSKDNINIGYNWVL